MTQVQLKLLDETIAERDNWGRPPKKSAPWLFRNPLWIRESEHSKI